MGGPQEIARDVIRLVTTAGLGKDVIDLLEKKVALLTEQITTLETENLNLKQKVYDLEQELDRLRPQQGRLEEGTKQMLKLFFDSRGRMPLEQIASTLNMAASLADYHADILQKAEMIELGGLTPGGARYVLTAKGRAYVVKNKLA